MKANWKENQPTLNYGYNCSARCTIPHLGLQVHGSNAAWFSVVGSCDTIRASHPGESPEASPRSTQPGKMSNYIFVLMSPPCGFNTHLPLNVSDEKSESLAGWRCSPSLQQEGLQWELCLARGKSSNTVTKTGREGNIGVPQRHRLGDSARKWRWRNSTGDRLNLELLFQRQEFSHLRMKFGKCQILP